MMAKLISDHASRLVMYRADAMDERIKREFVPAARFLLEDMIPRAEIAAAMARFVDQLKDAISRNRKAGRRRI
ncbi:hypothetical protein AS156_25235 [Bradyrhizobium macuxiense]|uniref:Uncharacterized protein n=2 Tax=Bradyrhizobium macuxiense TaxID=1755647 RepID=A0A109J6S0_9BRAD|nr:hypothetical protein AS156_25235 [Bradyrhizobium macuxiense]